MSIMCLAKAILEDSIIRDVFSYTFCYTIPVNVEADYPLHFQHSLTLLHNQKAARKVKFVQTLQLAVTKSCVGLHSAACLIIAVKHE